MHHKRSTPYRDNAKIFITELKKSDFFKAQSDFMPILQSAISVDRLKRFVNDNNLTSYKKISWGKYLKNKNSYTLNGNFVFDKNKIKPFAIVIKKYDNNKTGIEMFAIGKDKLDANSSKLSIE